MAAAAVSPRWAQGVFCAFAALCCVSARSQEFPLRPVRWVIGPSSDVVPRLIAQHLSIGWRQQVVVDPRPGGQGMIAAEIVAKAAPDGYTWLLSTAAYTIHAALYPKAPYDVTRDYVPVARVGTGVFYLTAHPSLGAKSVPDLIALARAKPGQLRYASSGNGTPPHLATEWLGHLSKTEFLHVPHKSVAGTVIDTLSGQVQFSFIYGPSALPHIKSGKVIGLAVTSSKRSSAAPEIPTVAESGLAGFEVLGWNGVHVPRRTPEPIIARVAQAFARVVGLAEVQERMAAGGLEPGAQGPDVFAQFVRADYQRWAAVIKQAGIKAE